MASPKSRIEKNLKRIRQEIAEACTKARRSPDEVTLIAVTKTAGIEEIRAIIDLGVTELGESRVPQLIERAEELARLMPDKPARWHLIGHLQRNKVKPVLAVAGMIQSVDSLRLAEEINQRAEKAGQPVDVLMQVNCSQEPQKFGVAVGAALHLAELISTLKHLRLRGLMTMAPLSSDPQNARPSFALLRELLDDIRNEKIGGAACRELSMGMSNDFRVAIEEGATMLRIGTALFE
jgi:PLP dependent protein